MKRTVIFLSIILFLFVPAVRAATPTATQSATPTLSKDKQVEDLKERLATKVAQLSESQRSAISGSVKATSITSFTVETKTKDVKIELTDDIKVFQYLKGKRTALTINDISKGDAVVVFGQYDTTLDLMKANVVFIGGSQETRVSGVITDIDKVNYTISIKGAGDVTTIVDVEKTTRALDWITGKGEEKGGFSKLTIGWVATATGTKTAKTENRISASRIIQVQPAGFVQSTPQTATESAKPKSTPTQAPTAAPKP
jgi:hypothetical protein